MTTADAAASLGPAHRRSTRPSLWTRTPARNDDWFDEDQLAEMRSYYRPLRRLRLAVSLISFVAIVVFGLVEGGVWASELVGEERWWPVRLLAVVLAINVLSTVISLPSSAYVALSYDKRHGLSNQTPRLFAMDQVKELLVSTVVEGILLGAVFWALRTFDLWWLYAWAAFMVLQLVMVFVYPVLIMPRFNKFTPLEPGPLRTRIEEVAAIAGTEVEGIYTMDASKRSRRGNAFVAGFGATKRVVLFDTILEMPDEAIANIVAHEIGHYRLKHTLLSFPVLGVIVLAAFAFVELVANNDTALDLVGTTSLGDPASLPLFLVAFGVAFSGLQIALAWWSRYQERAADLEALELLGDPTSFMDVWPRFVALNKAELEKSWWSRLTSSHPEIAERLGFAWRWSEMNGVAAARPSKTRLDDPFAAARASG